MLRCPVARLLGCPVVRMKDGHQLSFCPLPPSADCLHTILWEIGICGDYGKAMPFRRGDYEPVCLIAVNSWRFRCGQHLIGAGAEHIDVVSFDHGIKPFSRRTRQDYLPLDALTAIFHAEIGETQSTVASAIFPFASRDSEGSPVASQISAQVSRRSPLVIHGLPIGRVIVKQIPGNRHL